VTRLLRNFTRGFTLVEIAVVLFILAALLTGLLAPLTAQVDQRKTSDTQRTLDLAMEALIGFAAANGRLPCPASLVSNGAEDCAGTLNGVNNVYTGYYPAAALGIGPVDAQGYLLDAWAQPQNRIRYSVTAANGGAFVAVNGMRTTGIGGLSPSLNVCAKAGVAGGVCNPGPTLASTAPAVIFSLGKNAPTGGTGADEAENLSNNRFFVSHTPTSSNAPNGEFDDMVVWMSANVLYNRLINAGQLP